jgi:glycerol kinase
MANLKQGEFVGSLDCGTTKASFCLTLLNTDISFPQYSSVRFIVFDKFANIVAQHQAEFPQYYPQPGHATIFLRFKLTHSS